MHLRLSAAILLVAALAALGTIAGDIRAEAARIVAPSAGDRVQIKFRDGTAIRLRDGQLVTLADDDLSDLQAIFDAYPGIRVERLFTRPEADLDEERASQQASGRPSPDLNLWFRLIPPAGIDTEALLGELNTLPIVETAYVEPPPAPPPGNIAPPPPSG